MGAGRWVWRAMAISALAVALAGCIGATTRDEFDDEVRSRGGGLTAGFVTDAVDVVARDLGADSWRALDVLSLRAQPGSRSVTVVVRQLERADFVDTVTVREGEIVASVPLQDAGDLPLDDLVIPLETVALDRVAAMRSEALDAFARQFGDESAFVDSVTLTRSGPDVAISVDVQSARRTATVVFDPDGTLRGIA